MRRVLIALVSVVLLWSCEEEEPVEETTTTQSGKISIEKSNALDSLHPNNLAEDLSWIVNIAEVEGIAKSYTITYQNGDEKTELIDASLPLSGKMNGSSAQFINDTTYYIPHIGNSKNGHFELYIYKDGSCEYKEVTD